MVQDKQTWKWDSTRTSSSATRQLLQQSQLTIVSAVSRFWRLSSEFCKRWGWSSIRHRLFSLQYHYLSRGLLTFQQDLRSRRHLIFSLTFKVSKSQRFRKRKWKKVSKLNDLRKKCLCWVNCPQQHIPLAKLCKFTTITFWMRQLSTNPVVAQQTLHL